MKESRKNAVAVRVRPSTVEAQGTEGFAQRLRTLRLAREWSQKDLASKAGLHHTHISRYENGTSRPTADALKRLAEALQVSGDYLFEGDLGAGRLQHDELLRRFQRVVNLPANDQTLILEILDAFLLRRDLEAALERASSRP
jgi:transcriptional regulator with XRE-family HTH domain